MKAPYAKLLGLWWFIIFGFKEMLLYIGNVKSEEAILLLIRRKIKA